MSVDSTAAPNAPVGPVATVDRDRGPDASPADGVLSLLAADLFSLGRLAAAARRATLGDRASFVRTRQLLPTGAWRGPRDAAESWVDEDDLAALGGWLAARAAGADMLIGGRSADVHRAAMADGARSLWRLPFASGEAPGDNRAPHGARIESLRALVAAGLRPWGVLPTPDGEPQGLDTLRVIAVCRLALPSIPHVVADVTTLGPRLAQMALGFGADELHGPIVSERALRLGDNARNPAMTRKEAAILIRGAGLAPCERLAAPDAAGGTILEEVTT